MKARLESALRTVPLIILVLFALPQILLLASLANDGQVLSFNALTILAVPVSLLLYVIETRWLRWRSSPRTRIVGWCLFLAPLATLFMVLVATVFFHFWL